MIGKYNLSYNQFGMSANFRYQDALLQLESILYPKKYRRNPDIFTEQY